MPADLALYDSGDAAEVSAITFSAVVPGTPAAAQEFHLWNHKGAASGDTATNVRASLLARKASVGGEYLAAGLDVLDKYVMEIRVIDGTNLTAETTGWQEMGPGSSPPLQDLSYNTALHVELRPNPDSSVATDDIEFLLVFDSTISTPIGDGFHKSSDGVYFGLAQTNYSGIVRAGTVVENTVPDFDVIVDEWMFLSQGEVWGIWNDTVTVGGTDTNGDTPGASEEFKAILTASNSLSLTVTKGVKAAAGSAQAPAIPANHTLVCTVTVDNTSILDADIDAETVADFFGMARDFATIGAGIAITGNRIVRKTSPEAPSGLGPSATYTIWLERNGSFTAVSGALGAAPSAGATPLWEVDTDGGSAITAARDKRRMIGQFTELRMEFTFDSGSAMVASDKSNVIGFPAYAGRRAWISPFDAGVVAYVDSDGGTSGETSIDLERNRKGGGWSTIIGANLGQMPQVAQGNTELYEIGHFVLTMEMAVGDQFRGSINSVPASAVGSRATLVASIYAV